jgi:hypothetical protein
MDSALDRTLLIRLLGDPSDSCALGSTQLFVGPKRSLRCQSKGLDMAQQVPLLSYGRTSRGAIPPQDPSAVSHRY